MMEFSGKLTGFTQDVVSDELHISFSVNEPVRVKKNIDALRQMEKLRISVVKFRKKRSLDANAYYWEIVGKMADLLTVSKYEIHNRMLSRYGQIETVDGKIPYTMLPDTLETERKIGRMEDAHFAKTSKTIRGRDGGIYRAYMLLRGSHTYDSKEMATLINGLVSEAEELGIETLTPNEIDRMVKAWHPKN